MTSRTRFARAGLLGAALSLAALSATGQVVCLVAELEEQQATPPTGSPARGTAVFLLDPVADTLTYELTMDQLLAAETAAHIHGYAAPGVSAGTRHTLPPGLHKTGVWNYPANAEQKILNGLAYVNVHTAAFGGGEIRGQILRDTRDATLFVHMDGSQEVPPNPSAAIGTGVLSMDFENNAAHFQITIIESLLFAPELYSHVHGFQPPGQNAPPRFDLPPGFHKKGVWDYQNKWEKKILAGLSSANMHTLAITGGEIRGHFLLQSCEPGFTSTCTAGISASGCQAQLFGSGSPSASLSSGFTLSALGAEGGKSGLFFYGPNGQQANAWGNGTSFQCVVPPVSRGQLMLGTGSQDTCEGTFAMDLNAWWCPTCPKSNHNPTPGAVVHAQLWYRDPDSTSNRPTTLSDALRFAVCP